MRKSGLFVVGTLLTVGTIYLSCGKGDDSDPSGEPNTNSTTDSGSNTDTTTSVAAGTVALETIQRIVQVTDPVAVYPAADTSEAAVQTRAFDVALKTSLTAQKGVLFGMSHTEIATAFGTAGSKAYCNSVNNAMKFFKEASQPDFGLCIFKTVAAKGQAPKANEFQTWDFKITASQGAMTQRMKFKIEPAEDGSIKSFENFSCETQGQSAAKQTGYAKQTVADGAVSVHTRSRGDKGQGEYKIRTDMNSKLGANGRPIGIKTIDYAEEGTNRKVHVKVRQAAHNIEVIGYETSVAAEEQFVRFVELLDTNASDGLYYVTKLGYGSGAALLRTLSEASTDNETASWNADTLKADATEDRRTQVTGREAELLASSKDDRNVEFAAAESYDCQGAADYTFEGTYDDFKECMGAYEIDQEGSTMCNAVAN